MKKRLICLPALILVLSLLLGACGLPKLADNKAEENPKLAQSAAEGDAAKEPEKTEDPETIEKTGEEEETLNVPVSLFKKYAQESASLWEFVQRFFPDVIVYKDALGQYCYEPINKDLPASDYDFDNLVNVKLDEKEFEYRVDGQTVSIKGIDVSRYQGDIDWAKVAADGVRFAFIRLGYRGYGSGKMVLDEKFEANIRGAIENGVEVGIYFVTQALNAEEGAEEAAFVLENIAPYRVTWPIVLDMEETSGSNPRTANMTAEERTDAAIGFCEAIKKAGHTPMLYTHIRWYVEELQLERLTDYDKWFAQYFNRPFFPYAFQIWQYTSSGKVDGIKGNVDLNISFVDYSKKVNSNGN
ncbi:MAG: glycoside hydrolase family 25 protein [Firmicutes bacterium]|nr:glycoside hydrolase family 25 protein [Bacillota bacterium]